jgi:cation transport protein ChaC
MNRAYERYAGRLTDEAMATVIARASGQLGACSEYLFNTVAHLAALGIHDRPLERLRDQVARHCAAAAAEPTRDS